MPQGCASPARSAPPKRVVAIEVVGIQEHLAELVPFVVRPAHAQGDGRRRDQQAQLVVHLDADAGDALLREEDLHVLLESGPPRGVEPLEVVVGAQQRLAPRLRERAWRAPRCRRRAFRPSASWSGDARADAHDETGRGAGPAARPWRRPRRRRAADSEPGEAIEAAIGGPVAPHGRVSAEPRASSRASTVASMFPPVRIATIGPRPALRSLPERSGGDADRA